MSKSSGYYCKHILLKLTEVKFSLIDGKKLMYVLCIHFKNFTASFYIVPAMNFQR